MRAPKIQAWKRGDTISAKKLDQPRVAFEDFLNKLGAVGKGGPGSGVRLMQLEVVTIEEDSLTCALCDADGAIEGSEVTVAKPYLLRNSIDSRGGISYSYSGIDSREADNSEDTEDQVVVPSYIEGDIIYAMSTPIGGTGVELVNWIDINVDGRAWAKSASA